MINDKVTQIPIHKVDWNRQVSAVTSLGCSHIDPVMADIQRCQGLTKSIELQGKASYTTCGFVSTMKKDCCLNMVCKNTAAMKIQKC